MLISAACIGVLTAIGSWGFHELIALCSWIFLTTEGYFLSVRLHGGFLAIPVVLVTGGVALLILNHFYPGDVLGYGFPNFLETVNLGNARLRRRWIFLKAIGAALSLGSGASVGREGPIAQIGGAIGSAFAQLRDLSASQARILVAAGAGAGIATTFNAPLGGMMFAQEIVLLGEIELGNLTLVIISTAIAVVTSRAITGAGPVFQPPMFTVGAHEQGLTYGLMGLVIGVLAAGYIRLFHWIGRFTRNLPIHPAVRLLAGLVLVGIIAIPLPENLSDGYPVINLALHGGVPLSRSSALTAGKMLASSVSLQAGAPGGVFGPVFFIGAMAGTTFRGVVAAIAPGQTGPPGSYALVALGAFLGAVTNAPLTALLLLFEMTRGDWVVVLPAMVSTLVALVVARLIEPDSIDSYGLTRDGESLEIGRDRRFLAQLPVSSVLQRNVITVNEGMPLPEVLRVAGQVNQTTLPVLNDKGGLTGLIVIRDLLEIVGDALDLRPLVNAIDLSRRNPPFLKMDSNLDQAVQTMEYEALEELPVAEAGPERKFLGLVMRREIAASLSRMHLSLAILMEREDNISWATGYRVSRFQVPLWAVGKTLRELDLRARFGVSVLAVGRVEGSRDFEPPSIDHVFKPGEIMVVAGTSSALRRFSRATIPV